MDAAELAMHRANTTYFISVNATSLVLTSRVEVKDAYGTRMEDLGPRPAQTVRLIDQSSSSSPSPGEVRAADGKQRKVQYQLLMEYDAEVGLYDYWVDDYGIRWEVADIFPDNGYERRAKVVRYGES